MREEDREGEQHFDDNTNGPKLRLRTSFSQSSLAHVTLQVITNGRLFKFYIDLVKYYVEIYIIIQRNLQDFAFSEYSFSIFS